MVSKQYTKYVLFSVVSNIDVLKSSFFLTWQSPNQAVFRAGGQNKRIFKMSDVFGCASKGLPIPICIIEREIATFFVSHSREYHNIKFPMTSKFNLINYQKTEIPSGCRLFRIQDF